MARTTVPNELVAINAIQGTLIADNAITAVHIATNAVSSTLVADNAITASHIATDAVTTTQVQDQAITSAKIAANTIATGDIADNAIDSTKIAQNSILTRHIDDSQVTTSQIADNSITSAKIVNGTIVAADLADDAVTIAKMAALTRGSIIAGDSSGDPAALAIGTNDYVLTSDGTDIAWEAAGGKTTEEIQDLVGAMFTGNTETNVEVTYQDEDGTIDVVGSAVTRTILRILARAGSFIDCTVNDATLTITGRSGNIIVRKVSLPVLVYPQVTYR